MRYLRFISSISCLIAIWSCSVAHTDQAEACVEAETVYTPGVSPGDPGSVQVNRYRAICPVQDAEASGEGDDPYPDPPLGQHIEVVLEERESGIERLRLRHPVGFLYPPTPSHYQHYLSSEMITRYRVPYVMFLDPADPDRIPHPHSKSAREDFTMLRFYLYAIPEIHRETLVRSIAGVGNGTPYRWPTGRAISELQEYASEPGRFPLTFYLNDDEVGEVIVDCSHFRGSVLIATENSTTCYAYNIVEPNFMVSFSIAYDDLGEWMVPLASLRDFAEQYRLEG